MQSARAVLRRLQIEDYQGIRELESDADVMRFTGLQQVQSPEASLKRLHSQIEQQKQLEPFGIWVAIDKNNEEFIGWFMLMPYEVQKLELGFMITKKNFGHGLCTEIASTLIQYAQTFSKIESVVALTAIENEASVRVLKKLNFHEVGQVTEANKILGGIIHLRKFELIKNSDYK